MLDGHGGEIILGVVFIIIAVVVVWALVTSASAGIEARRRDRQQTNRQW